MASGTPLEPTPHTAAAAAAATTAAAEAARTATATAAAAKLVRIVVLSPSLHLVRSSYFAFNLHSNLHALIYYWDEGAHARLEMWNKKAFYVMEGTKAIVLLHYCRFKPVLSFCIDFYCRVKSLIPYHLLMHIIFFFFRGSIIWGSLCSP